MRSESKAEVSNKDFPPHSRLFIVGNKTITEEEYKAEFSQFGDVISVWLIKDKHTGEYNGIAYIQFAKTSEAAKAVEAMHGQILGAGNSRPIKVLIANSPEMGSKRDDHEMDRYNRLFIMVPKDAISREIELHFEQFGHVDNVTIIRDKVYKDSKRFAYVKFSKMSEAALAYETCDSSFRAKFADPHPRDSSSRAAPHTHERGVTGPYHDNEWVDYSFDTAPTQYRQQAPRDFYPPVSQYGVPAPSGQGENSTLIVFVHLSVTNQQLYALLDLIPGLDNVSVHPDHDIQKNVAVVRYTNVQSTRHALEKLGHFQYPIGCPIRVVMGSKLENFHSASRNLSNFSYTEPCYYEDTFVPSGRRNPHTTQDGYSDFSYGDLPTSDADNTLPSTKPLVHPHSVVAERLFIVCNPSRPEQYVLKDIFCRFGNLIDVYMVPHKRFGYVRYSVLESAQEAIKTLNGLELDGVKYKVMIADPPNSSKKRLKEDDS